MWRSAARASAWRPERVSARACSAQTRSCSGYRVVACSVAATTTAWSPSASRPSTRASSALRRSWASVAALEDDLGLVGQVGVRLAGPEPEQLLESGRRAARSPRGSASPGAGPVVSWLVSGASRRCRAAHLVGEVVRVDLLAAQRQPVAVVAGEQHLRLLARAQAGLEHPPYAGEVGVQRAVRTAGRVLAPDESHQRVRRDVAAQPERQRRQHRARLAGADVHGGRRVVPERHLARTEHAHPHAHNVPATGVATPKSL